MSLNHASDAFPTLPTHSPVSSGSTTTLSYPTKKSRDSVHLLVQKSRNGQFPIPIGTRASLYQSTSDSLHLLQNVPSPSGTRQRIVDTLSLSNTLKTHIAFSPDDWFLAIGGGKITLSPVSAMSRWDMSSLNSFPAPAFSPSVSPTPYFP